MVDEPMADTDAAAPGVSHADLVRAALAGKQVPEGRPASSATLLELPVGATQLLDAPLPASPPDLAVPLDLFEVGRLPEPAVSEAILVDEPAVAEEQAAAAEPALVDEPVRSEVIEVVEAPAVLPAPVPIMWVPSSRPDPTSSEMVANALAASFTRFGPPPSPVASKPWTPLPGGYVPPPPPLEHGIASFTVRHKRHRLRRSLVVIVALVLVAGTAGGYLYWRHHTSGPSAWDVPVLPIVHFVEHERGLQFKHPVAVVFLPSAQFDKVVSVPQPTSSKDRAQMDESLRALRALGLVTGNVDLASSLDTLSQAEVVGLYMSDKKTVYVRGDALTPFVQVTLAHELTHALQDQYFGLDQLQSSARSGDSLALTALIEGDATRVEHAYEQTLSPDEQQTYQQELQAAEQRSGQASSVPAVVSDLTGFPYAFGPTYVDALTAQGGTASLNAAFRDPPRAQAQILDPDTYPSDWRPVPVARPALPAGSHVLDTAGPFGQAMLFEVLGSRLGYEQAWAAVQGWQGDSSVPYSNAGKTCVAIDVRMGSPAQSAVLAAAESAWAGASHIPGATVRAKATLVSLRSCDPGAAATSPAASSPSAFDVLAARAQFIDGILSSGPAHFATARCVVDAVMGQLGPGGYGELTAASISPSQQQSLGQMTQAAAGACRAAGVG